MLTGSASIELRPDELVQILKPLLGLTDSGDYWSETNHNSHKGKLQMEQSTGDFALFFRKVRDQLVSLSGSYVDEVFQAGTKEEKERLQTELKN